MPLDLTIQNPWWEDAEAIYRDRLIKRFSESRFKWFPEVLKNFNLNTEGIFTLRGPRQVGKTTLLKLLIQKLIKLGNNPKEIFYYSFDLIRTPQEIFDLYQQYLNYSSSFNIKRRYLFFDEITFVNNWQYAIKNIVDSGLAEKATFILTGSSAIDLKRGAEKLPGRRGKGKDMVLLPLNFSQFFTKIFPEFSFEGKMLELDELTTGSGDFEQKISFFKVHQAKFQEAFEKYTMTGGFPLAVESFLNFGRVTQEVGETYFAVVSSDFEKLKKSRVILRQMLRRVFETVGSSLSWQRLAHGTDVPSYNTARDYVELLADNFLMNIIYFYDPKKQSANPNKGKKFYFADPFLFNIVAFEVGLVSDINTPIINMPEFKGRLAETICASEIIRQFEPHPFQGFAELESLFYWRSNKGREIDFVVVRQNKPLPIEVKYQERILPADISTIKRIFGRGMVITKNEFFLDEKVIGIPIYLFPFLKV